MAQSEKSSSGPVAAVARRKTFGTLAYTLPDALAREFVAKDPPAGLKLAFVPTTVAAERELRDLLASAETADRISWVPYELGVGPAAETTIEADAYAPSARARALLQGFKIAEADLREAGGAFDLEQVQALLNGITRQAVDKRVKEGSLLAVPGPSNRRRYPTVQFTRDGLVAGLKEVQEALPTSNPWAVLNFFVRPDDRLGGRRPIDVLREGDVDLVISAAQGMGVQGG